jgi:tetratricopeptide (TPR) repeat protein
MPPQPRSKSKPAKRDHRWYLVALLLATALAYGVTLRFGYVYDDVLQIENNPRIKSVDYLPSYFTRQVWAQAQGQPANLYRPFFLSWLWFNFEIFGASPAGWHLTAILMHLLAVWLVYLLARKLLPDDGVSAYVAAGIFALHPAHVEAVAWISGATEPLSSALFLGSFLLYLKARGENWAAKWLAVSLALYASAMLMKESTVVLPAVIVVYELCFPAPPAISTSKSRFGLNLKILGAYCGLMALYFLARANALHGLAHRISDVPVWNTVMTWPWVLYFYLAQLLAPAALGPFYDVRFARGADFEILILPALVWLALAAGLWYWARKSHSNLPLFMAAWFLLTISPALASFVVMSRYENVHDRYTYLPSVAFAILIGLAWNQLGKLRAGEPASRKLMAMATLLLLPLAAMTYRQSLYWANDETLFTRGVAVAPKNVLDRLNLASEMIRQHRFEAAFDAADRAVQLDPRSALALNSAAESAYFLGNYSTTEDYYQRALALASPRVDQLFYLGLARIATGNYHEALASLQQGQVLWPDSPGYHAAMGSAYAHLGDWQAARDEYKKELILYPDSPGASKGLTAVEQHLQNDPGSGGTPH